MDIFSYKAWGSKILWFLSLLEGNLPSSKDKNQSFLLNQALLHFDFHFISQIEECQIDSHVEKTDWSDRESGQIDRSTSLVKLVSILTS